MDYHNSIEYLSGPVVEVFVDEVVFVVEFGVEGLPFFSTRDEFG